MYGANHQQRWATYTYSEGQGRGQKEGFPTFSRPQGQGRPSLVLVDSFVSVFVFLIISVAKLKS